MKERSISQTYLSRPSVDGAGVHLRRLFWRKETLDMDPFLLLDLFDTTNPDDYRKGFPMHPHRGIETLTYLIEGEISHEDTIGNKGTIRSGDCQWMSSGSGIMHEEMPQVADRMFGFQLWINLPQERKMSTPTYLALTGEDIPVYEEDGNIVKVIAGTYKDVSQQKGESNHPVHVYDILVQAGKTMTIPVAAGENCLLVSLEGEAQVAGQTLRDKEGFLLVDGDVITVKAGNAPVRLAMFAGERLDEPIAWGGSIVMNTQEELRIAMEDLRKGTFIK